MDYQIVQVKGASNYFVDTNGMVYRKNIKGLYPLKPKFHDRGYYRIAYYDDNGKFCNYLLHRLVADTFIKNENNLATVNHKDMHKTNNSVHNLEWMSIQDNIKHAIQNGGIWGAKERIIPQEFIEMIQGEYTGKHGDRKRLAEKYGITHKLLLHILGPYDKDFNIDEEVLGSVRDMYSGRYGDIKRISEALGLTHHTVKRAIEELQKNT